MFQTIVQAATFIIWTIAFNIQSHGIELATTKSALVGIMNQTVVGVASTTTYRRPHPWPMQPILSK